MKVPFFQVHTSKPQLRLSVQTLQTHTHTQPLAGEGIMPVVMAPGIHGTRHKHPVLQAEALKLRQWTAMRTFLLHSHGGTGGTSWRRRRSPVWSDVGRLGLPGVLGLASACRAAVMLWWFSVWLGRGSSVGGRLRRLPAGQRWLPQSKLV